MNDNTNTTAEQGMENDSTKVESNSKPCCCGKSKTGVCDGTHKQIVTYDELQEIERNRK